MAATTVMTYYKLFGLLIGATFAGGVIDGADCVSGVGGGSRVLIEVGHSQVYFRLLGDDRGRGLA